METIIEYQHGPFEENEYNICMNKNREVMDLVSELIIKSVIEVNKITFVGILGYDDEDGGEIPKSKNMGKIQSTKNQISIK